MDFNMLNDQAILHELGARVQRCRLDENLTQNALARKAGVSRKVIQTIEAGQSFTFKGLIKTLRVLGELNQLDRFLPEPGLSPLQLAKLKGRQRQRASGITVSGT